MRLSRACPSPVPGRRQPCPRKTRVAMPSLARSRSRAKTPSVPIRRVSRRVPFRRLHLRDTGSCHGRPQRSACRPETTSVCSTQHNGPGSASMNPSRPGRHDQSPPPRKPTPRATVNRPSPATICRRIRPLAHRTGQVATGKVRTLLNAGWPDSVAWSPNSQQLLVSTSKKTSRCYAIWRVPAGGGKPKLLHSC